MYNRITSITVLLFTIILNNSQLNYCNCNSTSIILDIEGVRVFPYTNDIKKLVSTISLSSEQEIDLNKIRPFIQFNLAESRKGNSSTSYSFPIKKWGFKLFDIVPNQKEKLNSIFKRKFQFKKQKHSILFKSVLYFGVNVIKIGLQKKFEECQKDIFDKKKFEFQFNVKFEYNVETTKDQEFKTRIISSDLNSWMMEMLLVFQNESITPQIQLSSELKFSLDKNYKDEQYENTKKKGLINMPELCIPDLFHTNENYSDEENVKFLSTETIINQDTNAHTKEPEFTSELNYQTSEIDNECRENGDSVKNDNISTSVSGSAMNSNNSKGSENTGNRDIDGENTGIKDTGFSEPTSLGNNGGYGNNSRITGATGNSGKGTVNTNSGGAETESENIKNSGNNENNPEEPPKEPPKKSKIGKISGVVVLSIVLIAVVVYFYFIIKRLYFTKKEVEYVY